MLGFPSSDQLPLKSAKIRKESSKRILPLGISTADARSLGINPASLAHDIQITADTLHEYQKVIATLPDTAVMCHIIFIISRIYLLSNEEHILSAPRITHHGLT